MLNINKKIENGKATQDVEYLSAMEEDRYYIGTVSKDMKEG